MQLILFVAAIFGSAVATAPVEHQTAPQRCALYETMESAIYLHTTEIGCPLGEFCRADNALCALQYCPYPFGWCLPVDDDEPTLYKLATDVQRLSREFDKFRIILGEIQREHSKMTTTEEITTTATTYFPTVIEGPCDHLNLEYSKKTEALDSCLVLLDGTYSWIEADAECKSRNGQLLYLPTAYELDIFKQVLNKFQISDTHIWIGLFKNADGWFWSLANGNQPAGDKIAWGEGEPNNQASDLGSTEDCGHLYGYQWGDFINDSHCPLKFTVICQLNIQ